MKTVKIIIITLVVYYGPGCVRADPRDVQLKLNMLQTVVECSISETKSMVDSAISWDV